ncbi:MAG: GTPase ObgE [Lachnospiraceae bacterium]|nr:GTPase ObgE [Lachnospiraceae bacterium]
MFNDRAKIYVRSGKGGDGHVSFRREKYVPNGGPDGGDGGDGGSVYLEIDEGMNTLSDYRHVRKYKAQDGEDGGKKKCRGKNGADLILKMPEGTVVKEATTGKVITDLSGENRRFLLLKGGRGGNGNQHYATSTMQAPKYAQPGGEAGELELLLELKLLADVGLVGLPNVGKSTFLTRVSNARPEIADYHFTTINPHLGVVDVEGIEPFVIADIPGLIEGASEGAGLGHEFLRHIERTRVLIHILDASGIEGRDPIEDFYTINNELEKYNADISKKKMVIAANKTDCIMPDGENADALQRIKDEFEPKGIKVFPICALSSEGLMPLLGEVSKLLEENEEKAVVFEQEFFPEFMLGNSDEPFSVSIDEETGEFVIDGPRIEKMLGYTNLDSEKGFVFFQNFLKDNLIIDELKGLGIKEGDIVRVCDMTFEYYN